jgi:hypothetical protein
MSEDRLDEKSLKELQQIKRLLIAQLLLQGVSASDIADILGIDQGDFSRTFPVRKLFKNLKQKR